MKKISLLAIFFATTMAHGGATLANAEGTVAVAPSGPACPKAFEGFHIGGNIGYGVGGSDHRFSTRGFGTPLKYDVRVKGLDGGLGVGYTQRFCSWALGIEFDANWANSKGKEKTGLLGNGIVFNERLKNSLQLLARVGYVLREIAMPFVGLGWDNSQWRQGYNATLQASSLIPTAPAGLVLRNARHKTKRLNGFLWRAGVDFLATQHVIFGLEYTGSITQKSHFKQHVQTNGLNFVAKSSIRPQYNKFALTAKVLF